MTESGVESDTGSSAEAGTGSGADAAGAPALGRDVASRLRLPGPPRGQLLPSRIGSLASSVQRFAAATSRPVDVRLALRGPGSAGSGVRPPRWWAPGAPTEDEPAASAPVADPADAPVAAPVSEAAAPAPEAPASPVPSDAPWLRDARAVDADTLPDRTLPRAARSVPQEDTYSPGGILGGLTATDVRVRRHAEVAASGPMVTPSDRQRLVAVRRQLAVPATAPAAPAPTRPAARPAAPARATTPAAPAAPVAATPPTGAPVVTQADPAAPPSAATPATPDTTGATGNPGAVGARAAAPSGTSPDASSSTPVDPTSTTTPETSSTTAASGAVTGPAATVEPSAAAAPAAPAAPAPWQLGAAPQRFTSTLRRSSARLQTSPHGQRGHELATSVVGSPLGRAARVPGPVRAATVGLLERAPGLPPVTVRRLATPVVGGPPAPQPAAVTAAGAGAAGPVPAPTGRHRSDGPEVAATPSSPAPAPASFPAAPAPAEQPAGRTIPPTTPHPTPHPTTGPTTGPTTSPTTGPTTGPTPPAATVTARTSATSAGSTPAAEALGTHTTPGATSAPSGDDVPAPLRRATAPLRPSAPGRRARTVTDVPADPSVGVAASGTDAETPADLDGSTGPLALAFGRTLRRSWAPESTITPSTRGLGTAGRGPAFDPRQVRAAAVAARPDTSTITGASVAAPVAPAPTSGAPAPTSPVPTPDRTAGSSAMPPSASPGSAARTTVAPDTTDAPVGSAPVTVRRRTASGGPTRTAAASTSPTTGPVAAANARATTALLGAERSGSTDDAGDTGDTGAPFGADASRGPATPSASLSMPDQLVVRRRTGLGRREGALASGFGYDDPIQPATAGGAKAPAVAPGAALGLAAGLAATTARSAAPGSPAAPATIPTTAAPTAAPGAPGSATIPGTPSARAAGLPSPPAGVLGSGWASRPGGPPAPASGRVRRSIAPAPSRTSSPSRPGGGLGGAPVTGAGTGGAPRGHAGSARRDDDPSTSILRRLSVVPPRLGMRPQTPDVLAPAPSPATGSTPTAGRAGSRPGPATPASATPASATRPEALAGSSSLVDATAHLFADDAPVAARPNDPLGGSPMSSDITRAPGSSLDARPSLAPSSAETGWLSQFQDPQGGAESSQAVTDRIVDAVVERLEQRVIDELERRGRRQGWGGF